MIEVTQKNRHGTVEIIAQFETEEDFGKAYWPPDVESDFSTNPNGVMVDKEWVHIFGHGYYINNLIFNKVAYNEKGKKLDVGHLVGIARKYNWNWNRWNNRPHRIWGFKRCKRHCKGVAFRQMRTTQERRWAHAWDDEEFAPKVRTRRSTKHLPNAWDDYWRYDGRIKNWKRYRKHQWKEKK